MGSKTVRSLSFQDPNACSAAHLQRSLSHERPDSRVREGTYCLPVRIRGWIKSHNAPDEWVGQRLQLCGTLERRSHSSFHAVLFTTDPERHLFRRPDVTSRANVYDRQSTLSNRKNAPDHRTR